jgi:acyl carrier protein
MVMETNEFLDFINKKTGMELTLADMSRDLSEVDGWDSLSFVYMIIEFEHSNNINLNIEKLLACHTLQNIREVINHEIRKGK